MDFHHLNYATLRSCTGSSLLILNISIAMVIMIITPCPYLFQNAKNPRQRISIVEDMLGRGDTWPSNPTKEQNIYETSFFKTVYFTIH
jgi:hypothetical protein